MKKGYWMILSSLILLSIGLLAFISINKSSQEMTYPSFIEAVTKNQVDSVKLSENKNTFQASLISDPDHFYTVPNPKTEHFTEYLLLNKVTVTYQEDTINAIFPPIFLILCIIGGILFFQHKNGSRPLIVNANKKKNRFSTVTLKQVAGNTEAKYMMKDIIQFIKEPEKYTTVGAKMPRGILLYGPPGTGKTLMAKAIAGEADVPFFAMSGSDFVQMYVGVGASRIRQLFGQAKKSDKAVIFIDEIDAIGKKRGRNPSASNDERDQTLNALLTEMSGFQENAGIIVIGATNRLDSLDEALLRPGRFDRQIEMNLPDVNARIQILLLHAQNKPFSDDVDFTSLGKSTVGFSGAMLEHLLNEAAISAANDHSSIIHQEHIEKAYYTVLVGSEKQDRSYITEEERKITAYHEAGHTLATRLLLPEHCISKVTIIPSINGIGGFHLSIPKDTMFQTKRQLLFNIQVLLAGRAAEELIFGEADITTGANNDIMKASSYIVDYMNKFGMDSEMGLFSTTVLENAYDKKLIDKSRTKMNQLYEETKTLLHENLSLLEQISRELLEKESLNEEDILRICS